MSNRQTKVGIAAVVLAGWAVACSAGVGSPPDIGQAYGDNPGAFGTADRPGVDNQDPASGAARSSGGEDQGSSGSSGNNPTGGSSGSSGSGGNGDCPPCDGNVTCEVTVGGQTSKATLPLSTKGGQCVASSSQGDIIVACGGQLTQNGQPVGTWKNCTKVTTSSSGGTPTDPPAPTPVDAGTKG